MNLLPPPRSLQRRPGIFIVPAKNSPAKFRVLRSSSAPDHPEGYALVIDRNGVTITFREQPGLRAACATLRQLIREYGRRLPCLRIRDWPDFPRRGVMLDISRGRVPKLETLLDLASRLADLKINELQLYTEHTFAYRKYKSIWQSWGALTAAEIRELDAHCRALGIDLVPNQNSFGHLRYFLADPGLKKLAELPEPYEAETRDFLRRPTTLAPNHPGTLPFLRGLYDELLPHFSSPYFNIGADETWDLGKGQSKRLCVAKSKGRVYIDFLKKLHREVKRRDKRMMFWGDIILKYPGLIRELPADVIALNWGYEKDHPFAKETVQFARAKIPFYVCPGTSTWMTLLGRHDNALANLQAAARTGKKAGAIGYLNTDWGDGGHPQPFAVSWPLFAAGASLAWNAKKLDRRALFHVLNWHIYEDPSGKIAKAAWALGFTHQKLGVKAPNETPLGTVIAAPKPSDRELFCRNGLKWFVRIPAQKIKRALAEIEKQRRVLARAKPATALGKLFASELDLAARMAAESCQFMLWQKAVASGKQTEAGRLAHTGVIRLKKIQKNYRTLWPRRNKATPKHSTPFLQWRIDEYRAGKW